jgi:AdoMet-dependent heme synthase
MISRLPGFLRSVFRNRRRRDDRPRFLTYTVTFACNAKCVMCDSWKLSAKGDLTPDEVSRIFDQLPRMDAVRLTGGEPFVRKDMPELAELTVRKLKPLMLHVTTNGFLTDRIVDFCERRPRNTPLELLVSIDGVGEKHNEIRGNSTAYRSCLDTLQALASRRKELRLKLAVNQTIVDAEGVEHYRRLRDVLQPMGIRNNVVIAYDVSATYNQQRDVDVAPRQLGEFTTFGEFTADDVRELAAEIERDLPRYPLLQRIAKRYYLRGVTNRLLGNAATEPSATEPRDFRKSLGSVPNPKCVALNTHLRLFPNGDVPTCQFNSRIVGNLREQSFDDVWTGLKAAAQRTWVRKCPGCWAECEVLPSAIYTGDLLREFLPFRKPIVPAETTTAVKPPAVTARSRPRELELPILETIPK